MLKDGEGGSPTTAVLEYFDGDSGRGLGASHQTGWTALAVRLIEGAARARARERRATRAAS